MILREKKNFNGKNVFSRWKNVCVVNVKVTSIEWVSFFRPGFLKRVFKVVLKKWTRSLRVGEVNNKVNKEFFSLRAEVFRASGHSISPFISLSVKSEKCPSPSYSHPMTAQKKGVLDSNLVRKTLAEKLDLLEKSGTWFCQANCRLLFDEAFWHINLILVLITSQALVANTRC